MSESKSQKTKKTRPEAPAWLLDNIAEASKNARKIYLLYIGFLAYCALTVVSTTDRQIVLNEPARLPIIDVEVALNGFFLLSPLLAIFVFIYFQIYLNKLKRLTDDLRLNYAPVAQGRLYPWLLNFAEEIEKGFVGTIQRFIVNFSLWWSLPLVLMIISLWYIKKHDPVLSYVLAGIPAIGAGVVILFWQHYASAEKGSFIKRHKNRLGLLSLVLVVEYFLIFSVIPSALKGERTGLLGGWTNVDLSHEVLIDENLKDYPQAYWVNLKGAHLQGANLTGAVMNRADLEGAELLGAKLDGAYLKSANFIQARFSVAQLRGANLEEAQLQGVNLANANLQGANLREAQLQGTILRDANLQGADLYKANLERARLLNAKLDSAYLVGAQLRGAYLEGAQLRGANLEESQLQGVNLVKAQLQGAILWRAQLQGAILAGAQLQNANLSNAHLQGVQKLTVEQLSEVKTLYEAKLDSNLMAEIKKKYPYLLEAPEKLAKKPEQITTK